MTTLIHIAHVFQNKGKRHLFLRKVHPHQLTWFEEDNDLEKETLISASTIEEAMRLAARHWKQDFFTTVNCGFRYTLPERDEHGINAYFYQMAASCDSMNGVYYDDELGNNCFVQNASTIAIDLWKLLAKANRL